MFGVEPFSRRDAWVWLIESAAFATQRIGVGGKTVDVRRGQLCHSLRFMAKAWRWDEARVRRFLKRAEVEKMVACVIDAGRTLVTICNYEQYQTICRVADAVPDAAATQQRRSSDANNKEGKEGKEDSEEASASSADPRRVIFVDIAKWLAEERDCTLEKAKSWLGKAAKAYGDGNLIDACSRIRAGPYQNDVISALTAELKRSSNGKSPKSNPVSNLYAGAAIALARRAQRSADSGADIDPAQPLLDGGHAPRIARIADR